MPRKTKSKALDAASSDDCALAMAPSFRHMIEQARAAGWPPEAIALAVSSLAVAHLDEVRHDIDTLLARQRPH